MPYFVVHYTYGQDAARIDELRPAHRAYLGSLVGEALVASGPLTESAIPGAVLIMRTPDRATVEALLNEDPFWVAGLVTQRSIEAWNPVLGVFAAS